MRIRGRQSALLRQLNGKESQDIPTRNQVMQWMERNPSGLDPEVLAWREKTKGAHRIAVERIRKESEQGKGSGTYLFRKDVDDTEARRSCPVVEEDRFHLRHAVRSSEELKRISTIRSRTDPAHHEGSRGAGYPGVRHPLFSSP
jgi:lysine 2,3-aminomutase